jgi:hypothetical protein
LKTPSADGALHAYSIRLLDAERRTILVYGAMCRDDEAAKANRRGIVNIPYSAFRITRGDVLVAEGTHVRRFFQT